MSDEKAVQFPVPWKSPIHPEMRAAFPKEELSDGAERLRERLNSIPGWTDARLAPLVSAQEVAGLIVTELGIDAELVESLRIRLGTRAHDRAAGVMATLLEVAGK